MPPRFVAYTTSTTRWRKAHVAEAAVKLPQAGRGLSCEATRLWKPFSPPKRSAPRLYMNGPAVKASNSGCPPRGIG